MDITISEWQKMYPDIEIMYSTPEKYVKALKESQPSEGWPIRRDDSLPYSQTQNGYWNGFYSSRPQLKHLARSMSTLFHSSLALMSPQMLR
jgi:hypothetical protein